MDAIAGPSSLQLILALKLASNDSQHRFEDVIHIECCVIEPLAMDACLPTIVKKAVTDWGQEEHHAAA